MNIFKLSVFAFLTVIFSFVQFFNLSIFGVKPNFAIAIIAAVSFFVSDVWEGVFLVFLSAFILKFSPYLDREILIFSIAGILAAVFSKYLPWRHLVSNIAVTLLYTLIFYLFLFPAGIISLVFLQEVFYNILISSAVFLGLGQTFPQGKLYN